VRAISIEYTAPDGRTARGPVTAVDVAVGGGVGELFAAPPQAELKARRIVRKKGIVPDP
jgi:hypothetical protein